MSFTCATFYAVIVIIAKDELCQKWDLIPRPVNWTAILTQRLGPLGHPDSRNITLTVCNLYLGPNNLGLVHVCTLVNPAKIMLWFFKVTIAITIMYLVFLA